MKAHAVSIPATQRRGMTAFQALAALVLALALTIAQSVQAQPADAPASFADLAEEVSPAVVNITTATLVAGNEGPGIGPDGMPMEEFFEEFFNRRPGDGPSIPRRRNALGSGFVISEDGYIVTNNHVIEAADEIAVEFQDGREFEASVVGTDAQTDIALLKIESDEPLPHVPFGDSDAARVGDWVLAVGNPLGQGFSVSAGIISASGRMLQGAYDDFIQTDAAINRGNSGGPLFNMDGEVIGVNTAILSPTGGSIGIGFAMSSNVVTRVVEQLRDFGETRRGWLGVRIQNVDQDMADALGMQEAAGALVTEVMEGPAGEAGMRAGDVIVRFDGTDIADSRELVQQVGRAPVGGTVNVAVVRDGEEMTLEVTLGRREEAQAAADGGPGGEPAETELLGLTVTPLDDELRAQLGLDERINGLVVVGVDPASEAAEKGIESGDVITEAGQEPVRTNADFAQRVEAAREAGRTSILLLIRRGGDPRFVALSVDE
ncbi:serine protease [Rhodobacteraceae bacterium WD3A24]|nr:serine protease [Rhodobacteraceae bacterium WD3A24]